MDHNPRSDLRSLLRSGLSKSLVSLVIKVATAGLTYGMYVILARLMGVPLGDKQDKLVEIYRQQGFSYAVESRRNLHNTYLDVLTNLGIIGLVVFLLGYIVLPLVGSARAKDGLGLFIILSFVVAMVPETWLDRSMGCIMLSFFFSLVSAWRR